MEILNAEFLTATILSGVTYDMLKYGAILSVETLRERLKNWLIGEQELSLLADGLNNLQLTDEMSETAIERKIAASLELTELLKNIKPTTENNTIIQNHSGSGDNVGRDKIIHSGK